VSLLLSVCSRGVVRVGQRLPGRLAPVGWWLLVASGAEGRARAQDAVWVSSVGSMKCTNADEVILLLKASDAIAHDLCHACVPPLG
jgi:hypothetical protein